MKKQPLECDDRRANLDPSLSQPGRDVIEGDHMNFDVFSLVDDAKDAATLAGIDAGSEKIDRLGGTTGARKKTGDRLKIIKIQSRFFPGLSSGDLVEGLTGFDNTSDSLQQPRIVLDAKRTRSELLNEDDFIALGVIRQDRDSPTTLKDLA